MILAVDIGNSNIVLGCFENDQILFIERLSTNQNSTELEYTILIKNILELNNLSHRAFEGGIISSVVPSVTHTVQAAMTRLTGKPVMVVGPGIRTGLKIKLDNPAQLGSDRVADAVAAIHEYPCPLIIIDMGTATTIGVISEGRTYEGGLLLPGVNVSLEALSRRAAQLPAISLQAPKNLIGKSTEDCMRSGIVYGTAAMLDGIIDRIRGEFPGKELHIVATGGSAPFIVKFCRNKILYDKTLLMKGLWAIYKRNQ